MPRVLLSDHEYPDLELERKLFAGAGIEMVAAQCKTEAQVIEAAAGCAGILLQYAPITEGVVAALPKLGIVSRIGAGVDTVDLDACARHGVWVANSPDILGLGRIGKRVAHLARNSFKRVIACDPYLIDGDFPAYVERVSDAAALFTASDLVSIHTPLTGETRGLVNGALLQRMRPGSWLINTARGAIVSTDDLLGALDSGILAGAGLDVLPVEPVPPDSRLLGHPKVILTPHAAFFSVQAEVELRRKAAQNIVSWVERGRPDYVVVVGSRHMQG